MKLRIEALALLVAFAAFDSPSHCAAQAEEGDEIAAWFRTETIAAGIGEPRSYFEGFECFRSGLGEMVCPGDGENYFFKLFFGRKGRLAWFSLVVENNHRLAYYVAARRHGRAHCQDDEIFVWFEPKRDILLLEGKDTAIYSYGARGMAPHSAEGEACARAR